MNNGTTNRNILKENTLRVSMVFIKKRVVTSILKRNRKFILAGVLLFIVGSIVGYATYLYNPSLSTSEESPILHALEEKFSFFEELNIPAKILFIFLNNLFVSLLSIFLGAILGIFPVFAALLNGFIVGIVAGTAVESKGFSYLLAGIIPHGILELSAIFLSIGLGLKFGYLIIGTIASIFQGKSTEDVKIKAFFHEVKGILPSIVVLLLIAAFVEVLITGAIIGGIR